MSQEELDKLVKEEEQAWLDAFQAGNEIAILLGGKSPHFDFMHRLDFSKLK